MATCVLLCVHHSNHLCVCMHVCHSKNHYHLSGSPSSLVPCPTPYPLPGHLSTSLLTKGFRKMSVGTISLISSWAWSTVSNSLCVPGCCHVMSRHTLSLACCHVMSHHTLSQACCHVMSRHTLSLVCCHIMSHHTLSLTFCHVMSRHTLSLACCHGMSHHTLSLACCHGMSHHTLSLACCHGMSHHTLSLACCHVHNVTSHFVPGLLSCHVMLRWFLLCFVQCTVTRSFIETLSHPTCC